MHALKVFRSTVWLLLHKLSLPHYRYIRKMRRGDRLPLTQPNTNDMGLIPYSVKVSRHLLKAGIPPVVQVISSWLDIYDF